MTFSLQIKIRLVKWNNYIMVQVFFLDENMPAKWQRRKNGKKINDKMENTTSGCFFLRWFHSA